MKKRYKGYEVILSKRVGTKREAVALGEELKQQYGGWIEIEALALDHCPGDPSRGYGTMDHVHARYDGETYCDYCGGKL